MRKTLLLASWVVATEFTLFFGCSVDMGRDRPIDSKVPDLIGDRLTSDADPDVVLDAISQDGTGNLKLAQGGVATVGPSKVNTKRKYRLVECGFETGQRRCGAMFCITGGIQP